MLSKKKIGLALGFPLGLVLSTGLAMGEIPFPATQAAPTTTQSLFHEATANLPKQEAATLVLTEDSGVRILADDGSHTLEEVLLSNGYKLNDFRSEASEPVVDRKLEAAETLFLFKVKYEGEVTKIKIPAPVEEIESPMIAKGQRVVKTEGVKGVGLMTTITQRDISQDSEVNTLANKKKVKPPTVETLTVVKAPRAEVVLIGTGAPLPDSIDYPEPAADCSNGTSVPEDVDEGIKRIHDEVCKRFPEITTYGTFRGYCTYTCDHHDGLAMDIMVSGDRGWQVAEFLRENHKELGISNLIYEQKIWATYRPRWKTMSDRGSATANHFDHVHVSLLR